MTDKTPEKTDEMPTLDPKHPEQVRQEQNAQARLVLIQLQWLITILLVTAILWLGNNQGKLEQNVSDRLKVADELTAQMNELDDRLFALSPDERPDQITPAQSAENDWQLINIQLTAIQSLYQKGDYEGSSELLKGVAWQLSHENLHIATPLKNALIQGIQDDLTALDTLKNHPDAWQLHALKMQAVQEFLKTQGSSDDTLNKTELSLHNAQTWLSLAIGATHSHNKRAMAQYLGEALSQLKWLDRYGKGIYKGVAVQIAEQDNPTPQPPKVQEKQADWQPNDPVESLDEAIGVVQSLINNPPKSPPLTSVQIFKRR